MKSFYYSFGNRGRKINFYYYYFHKRLYKKRRILRWNVNLSKYYDNYGDNWERKYSKNEEQEQRQNKEPEKTYSNNRYGRRRKRQDMEFLALREHYAKIASNKITDEMIDKLKFPSIKKSKIKINVFDNILIRRLYQKKEN